MMNTEKDAVSRDVSLAHSWFKSDELFHPLYTRAELFSDGWEQQQRRGSSHLGRREDATLDVAAPHTSCASVNAQGLLRGGGRQNRVESRALGAHAHAGVCVGWGSCGASLNVAAAHETRRRKHAQARTSASAIPAQQPQ